MDVDDSEREGVDEAVAGELPKDVRRNRIAELARGRAFLSVAEASRRFGVSEVTARSDLQALEEQGRLRRIRGGAVALSRAEPHPERPFVQSLGSHAEEKTAIGVAAADLVAVGETIILDVGTTTTAVAQALAGRTELADVTVFTNGLTIALALESAIPRIAVVVTGGTLRPLQHSLVDPLGETILDRLHVNTVFLGCNGVHPEAGVTNVNLPEAAVKRRMLSAARRRVVVADGSKVGEVSLTRLCNVDEIDLLITGSSADADEVERLRQSGLDVEVVA